MGWGAGELRGFRKDAAVNAEIKLRERGVGMRGGAYGGRLYTEYAYSWCRKLTCMRVLCCAPMVSPGYRLVRDGVHLLTSPLRCP